MTLSATAIDVIPEKRSEGFVRPHPKYLETCERGLESRGIFDLESLHAAARNEKIEPLPTIFSYGTLMRGQSRFSAIKKHGLRSVMMAQCDGKLDYIPLLDKTLHYGGGTLYTIFFIYSLY